MATSMTCGQHTREAASHTAEGGQPLQQGGNLKNCGQWSVVVVERKKDDDGCRPRVQTMFVCTCLVITWCSAEIPFTALVLQIWQYLGQILTILDRYWCAGKLHVRAFWSNRCASKGMRGNIYRLWSFIGNKLHIVLIHKFSMSIYYAPCIDLLHRTYLAKNDLNPSIYKPVMN